MLVVDSYVGAESGPARARRHSLWAFCLQGHQVSSRVGVMGSPPRQYPLSAWGTRRVVQGLESVDFDSQLLAKVLEFCRCEVCSIVRDDVVWHAKSEDD